MAAPDASSADPAADGPDMLRPIRLAYLAPTLTTGGAERQMLSLAERLPRDRFEVEFIVLVDPEPLGARARAAGVPVKTVGHAPRPDYGMPARFRHRARKALRYVSAVRDGRFDIIDAWLYPADVLAALTRPLTRTPVVMTGRRNVDPQGLFGKLEGGMASIVDRMTDVVVANSAAAAAHAIASGRVSEAKIRIIRNGVVARQPTPAGERLVRRRELGIDDPHAIVIGCVANYLPVKRHDLLVAAFAALPPDPPTRLVLVGEGPLRPALELQIRELGLEARVRLHGRDLEPERLYGAFDIVAQASSREGLPNALLEAGAAGCAMVATSAGGSEEIVHDGVTGLLVPVDEAAGLLTALRALVSDAELRARLGLAAREHVTTAFGMDRFVADYAQVYEQQAQLKGVDLRPRRPRQRGDRSPFGGPDG